MSLLLTYIVCLINGYNLRQSLLALTVGAFLGLLTNWVRIITLVIVGYKTNMQSSLMHDHETFGWILFAIIILPALYFAPLLEKHISFKINAPKFKPLIPTLFLVLGPIVLLVSERNADYSNHLSIERLKLTQSSVSNINLADIPFSDTILISKGTASVDTTEIKLTLAKSIAPPENKKLVPYIGNFFDASEWAVEDEKPMEVDGEKFTLLTLKRVNSSHTSLLMYQFNVGKNNTGSYRQAKLLQLKARLLGEDFFGLFVMQASCKKECKDEVNALKETAKQWHQLKYYPKP
ncbi:MAG: exosortase/archaeosortase family protein [Gammaproteobacteria bacterium]|nr:MAG: exosortase/archaeosortase family protein [Gammaproteobacteria bacterium]